MLLACSLPVACSSPALLSTFFGIFCILFARVF
uniref:Uncharacterized protein n=1 Tax=Anguilla anguilla TaxID=7936 RepID=A0A0E9Y0S7_ANGAN